MRVLLSSSILLASAGCLSEAAFEEKYADKKCEEFERCTTSDASCDELGSTTGTGEPVECDFDKAAARECLKGPWVCDDQFEGYEFPIPPSACASVCGVAASVDTDAAM